MPVYYWLSLAILPIFRTRFAKHCLRWPAPATIIAVACNGVSNIHSCQWFFIGYVYVCFYFNFSLPCSPGLWSALALCHRRSIHAHARSHIFHSGRFLPHPLDCCRCWHCQLWLLVSVLGCPKPVAHTAKPYTLDVVCVCVCPMLIPILSCSLLHNEEKSESRVERAPTRVGRAQFLFLAWKVWYVPP